jgi:hypothetical protein
VSGREEKRREEKRREEELKLFCIGGNYGNC